jgi:hypothetical protein
MAKAQEKHPVFGSFMVNAGSNAFFPRDILTRTVLRRRLKLNISRTLLPFFELLGHALVGTRHVKQGLPLTWLQGAFGQLPAIAGAL